MNKGDQLIERGAARLERLSQEAAAKGGFGAKFADELAEDAAFLRKLKPSLIAARARGQTPAAHRPVRASGPVEGAGGNREVPPDERQTRAPSVPQIKQRRPKKRRRKGGGKNGGGPNPFLVAGVALAAGIALAKVIDWRGHAHPRD